MEKITTGLQRTTVGISLSDLDHKTRFKKPHLHATESAAVSSESASIYTDTINTKQMKTYTLRKFHVHSS